MFEVSRNPRRDVHTRTLCGVALMAHISVTCETFSTVKESGVVTFKT